MGKKMSASISYRPSTVAYIWGNFDVIRFKWQIAVLGIGELLFASFIWLLAGFHLIPTVRPLWQYGAIYYVVFAPIWLLNLFMSDSRSDLLFVFSWFANTFVFVVTTFVIALEIYGLIACYAGTIPVECRDNQLWDIVVVIITCFLWYITLIIFGAYSGILGRIRQAESIKGIRIRRVDDRRMEQSQ